MAKIFNTRSRRGGAVSPSIFVYSVLLACVFLVVFFWRSAAGNIFWTAVAPLQHLRSAFDASDNARLRGELASTTALVADRDALYNENLLLKARLGRDGSVQTILAGVRMRPPAVPYDTLFVDAGSSEGVIQGALVSAGGTTLIGIVGQVYAHTSRVILFSAPGETYDVLLRGAVPVNMQGQGAGSFIGQVPAGTTVAVGDTLVFSGIASGFAGIVSHVEAHSGESFKTLYARLPVDPLSLQYVEIRK